MLTLTQRIPANPEAVVSYTLTLTAEERTRSRHYFPIKAGVTEAGATETGEGVYLNLPRGTVLFHGDLLQAESGDLVRVLAKPEPVLTVTASTTLDLLRAAYHLGNRHVPLEVTAGYLRLSPDSVLQSMLEHLGATVLPGLHPFQPEAGAYGQGHASSHGHASGHSHASSHSHALGQPHNHGH